jgi:hypothetical protein
MTLASIASQSTQITQMDSDQRRNLLIGAKLTVDLQRMFSFDIVLNLIPCKENLSGLEQKLGEALAKT